MKEGGVGVGGSFMATTCSGCMVKHCEERFCVTTLRRKGSIHRHLSFAVEIVLVDHQPIQGQANNMTSFFPLPDRSRSGWELLFHDSL